MKDDNDIITTDNPLTSAQQANLAALLDAMIPADEDRELPSAAELDLVTYITGQAPEFIPVLALALNSFEEPFAGLPRTERHLLVEEFSKNEADLFNALLFHTFACYYQDDRVLVGLGLAPGPPFPRGNEIEPGDLSLLDPVLQRSQLYRSIVD
ncbi:MAG: hypothetical protein ABGY96_21525 [bacterium]|nr:hypothetical protein [Gammaproteobacteria bacterium]HIL98332.1 hypothetical protein [Pseudomonadales bacterium]